MSGVFTVGLIVLCFALNYIITMASLMLRDDYRDKIDATLGQVIAANTKILDLTNALYNLQVEVVRKNVEQRRSEEHLEELRALLENCHSTITAQNVVITRLREDLKVSAGLSAEEKKALN